MSLHFASRIGTRTARTCAGLIAILVIAGNAAADSYSAMPTPTHPPLPVELALGVHRVWSPPVRDSATRARRRAEMVAKAREIAERASGVTPSILFAEPPEVDALPPTPGPPLLPDSLTGGMSSVAVGDLNGDGLPDVASVEADDSMLVVRLNVGGGAYAPAVRYPLAEGAWKLVLSDFNGDGLIDVGVANFVFTPNRRFTALKNLGGGTFGARYDGELSGLPIDIAAADIGRDGRADLIFALIDQTHVDVVRSLSDGTFGPTKQLQAIDPDPWIHNSSASVGDIDGDGNPDVVLLYSAGDCADGPCRRMAVFYSRDDGSFEAPATYDAYDEDAIGVAGDTTPQVQDVDGDGRTDIGIQVGKSYPDWTPRPAMVRNNGQRRLDAPALREISRTPTLIAAGRLRHGHPDDLVYSDGEAVLLVRNQGNGLFKDEEFLSLGSLGAWVDLNDDGLDDLVIAKADSTEVRLADGTGEFGPPALFAGARFSSVADFNADHHLDLGVVLGNGDFGVMPGDGTGGFSAGLDFGIVSAPGCCRAVDLDADGRADLVSVIRSQTIDGDDSLAVTWNEGHGFSSPAIFDLGRMTPYGEWLVPMDLKAGDFNGDGLPDLAEVKGYGEYGIIGFVGTVPNLGHRSFGAPAAPLWAGEDPYMAAVADFDGDGLDDVVIAAATTDDDGRFLAFGGQQDGALHEMPGISGRGGYAMMHLAVSIAAGDFDGDGKPDVAVGCGYAPYRGAEIITVPNISPALVPTPTLASLVSSDAEPNLVSLTWDLGGTRVATIERRTVSADWSVLASASSDGAGRLRYDDHAVTPGMRYAYRLRIGSGTPTAETWIDVPRALALAIQGARPNPTRGPLNVAFTLATTERADLEVLDISGRRVRSLALPAPTAGSQLATLDSGAPLEPGLYFIRLTQGSARALTRVAVLH